LAAGNQFEHQLFKGGAARLLDLYQTHGRLTPREARLVIVPDVIPGTGPKVMAQRRRLTQRLFRLKLDGDPTAPNLIVKPRIPLRLLGVDADIEPDLLVAADTKPFYRPVEVKSYPDRAGKTDPADVRSACRQAAVAVISLRQTLARLGVAAPEALVPSLGDLILRVPGSYQPTLRPMMLRGEGYSIECMINDAPYALDELERLLAGITPSASLDDPIALQAIPNHYVSSCREHCALAERCKQQAIATGDPVLLGDTAREELAVAGSLSRTLALLNTQGPAPSTAQERALHMRLHEALQEYERAVGYGA
jgi:hypothetical protein